MAWRVYQRWIVVIITHIMLFQARPTGLAVAITEEICLMETFNPRCDDSSVIVIQTAKYGRMRPSDCDPVNKGNYGCTANVLHYMDNLCSGKSECSITVPDNGLSSLNICPRGHLPYLEIAHTCLPVTPRSKYRDICASDGVLHLAGDSETIIASSTVYTSQRDFGSCPIRLLAGPGQRINVTLVDFSHGRNMDGESSFTPTCHRYAVLSETAPSVPRTVCRGVEREKSIYMSESHQLEIIFGTADEFDTLPNFLFKISAVGCADPELNGNELTDRSPQTAELYCHSTGVTQRLACEGQAWDATAQSCDALVGAVAKNWSSLEGLLITLVIGIIIGVIMACMVMCCIWFCTKGRKTRAPPRQIVYYEGTSQWNAAPPIDQWEGNNGLIMDYNTHTLRKLNYEPEYHPLNHGVMMEENDELPIQSDRINRNIFDELPPLPPVAPHETEQDNGPYAKPVYP